jgi:murein DD-endopeptidase MepM/ murein hydrolase activator NlpD
MKSKLVVLVLLLSVVQVSWAQTATPLTLTLEPERIINGAPCVFRVTSRVPLSALRATWQEKQIFFDFDRRTRAWVALAGVGVSVPTDNYPLVLQAAQTDGSLLTLTYEVPVQAVVYPSTELEVERQYTNPNKAAQARIKAESAIKQKYFKQLTPQRLWQGSFAAPLDSIVTEIFGIQRTFNGERQSIHQGLDYRAGTGTPVMAMNSGTVLLARNFFYEGSLVVIDHGYGLLTLYFHLSSLRVREGYAVKRGELIGLSGATGRVTAPHLHVGVRWQGAYLDPQKLLQLALPQ